MNLSFCHFEKRPKIGLISLNFLAWSLFLYLFKIALPFFSIIPLYLISLAGILSAIYLRKNQLFFESPISKAMFVYISCYIFSIFFSVNLNRTILLSLSLIPGTLIFCLVSSYFNLKLLYQLSTLFVLISFTISISALWTYFVSESQEPAYWITEMGNPYILVPNDLIVLSLLLPFAIMFLHKNPFSAAGAISFISILSCLLTLVLYHSRAGFFVAFVSIFMFIREFYPKSKTLLCMIAGTSSLGAVDWFCNFGFLQKFFGVWTSRLPAWIIALEIFNDYPWIGSGPRTYGNLYLSYFQKINIPKWIEIDGRLMPWAHNLYLETLAEQGLLGITGLMVILFVTFILASRFRHSTNKDIYYLGTAVFSTFMALLLASVFEMSFIRNWFVIIFFSLIGFINILNRFSIGEITFHKINSGNSLL